jgi:predicted RNA binding protein YcfA (HicA-like mRNA interferase family)
MPRKIRQLKADLRRAGFELEDDRGKGSHEVWAHNRSNQTIVIAGKDGDDAKPYQEKQVRRAIRLAADASSME